MEVFDCSKYFSKNKADVFQSISREDLQSLHMESQERQGIFKPVITDQCRPIRAALIALNGYAGEDDYLDFFAFPNPMVEACRKHRSLQVQLPLVIEKYRSGVPALTEAAFYFTNFVKVYPPASKFKGAPQMDSLLKKHPGLTTLFRQYLMNEIIGLIKDECRIFICFGKEASRYFIETVQSDANNYCKIIGKFVDKDNNCTENTLRTCEINSNKIFVISDIHFSRFQHATTNYLVSVLANSDDE